MLDMISACNSALLANLKRDSDKKPEPWDYKDFLIFSRGDVPNDLEPVTLENGMTVSEFKMYIYMKALAQRHCPQ